MGSIVRDRYFLQQVIKPAPFQRVYLAEDRSHSSENCILKEFIARETGSAAQVGAAFQTELSALASIKHPQLQQLKDFFWESDRLFLVTTYVEGQTYQNWLRSRSALTEPEAIQLLNQILLALS